MNNPMLKLASALALVVSSAQAQAPAQALYMGVRAQSPLEAGIVGAVPVADPVAADAPSQQPVPADTPPVIESNAIAASANGDENVAVAVPSGSGGGLSGGGFGGGSGSVSGFGGGGGSVGGFGGGGSYSQAGVPMAGGMSGGGLNIARNPEVRKAEAELELAEAELNKVNQDVARDVTLAYQKWKRAGDELKRAQQMQKESLAPSNLQAETEASFQSLEAELRRLLGTSVPTGDPGALQFEALPEGLEATISIALQRNADIKTAKAKVNLAKATVESEQARIAHGIMVSSAVAVDPQMLDRKLEEVKGRVDKGEDSQDKLVELRAEADEAIQASRQVISHPVEIFDATSKRPEIQEELQARLDEPFPGQLAVDGDKTLRQVLDLVSESMGGFNFVLDIEADTETKLTLKLDNASIKNILLALADQSDGTCFVVRDYGILVTTRGRAEAINAPTIPDDIPLQMVRK